LAIIGALAVVWLFGYYLQEQEKERTASGPTYSPPTFQDEPFRVAKLNVSAYYNDAREDFTVKLTTNGGEATFEAPRRTERDLDLSLECTTASRQVYVELTDAAGRFRKGEWFTARCGASWSYFVGIDMNDAGIISLTFLQDPQA